ncbi:MAG: hypothetical protein AAF762_11535 [Pseudomonadota bacterium]
MTKATFVRSGGGLFPVDEDAVNVMNGLKTRQQVLIEVSKPRSVRQHRLFFKLLHHVTESGAWEYDVETLLTWVKYKLGRVEAFQDPVTGRMLYRPGSISFGSMKQDEFKPFFDRAVYALCTDILGVDDWEGLRNEIIDMVDRPSSSATRSAA